jgi:hypothetical protein
VQISCTNLRLNLSGQSLIPSCAQSDGHALCSSFAEKPLDSLAVWAVAETCSKNAYRPSLSVTVPVTKLHASRPRKDSPPYRAAPSQQYSVARFATLLVLSCRHSPGLRCSCCSVLRFSLLLSWVVFVSGFRDSTCWWFWKPVLLFKAS